MSTHNIGFSKAILMSTYNIGFYEEITKIIYVISSNIIKYALFCSECVLDITNTFVEYLSNKLFAKIA